MSDELIERANNARRLALMIVENRSGPALAAAIPHLHEAASLFASAGRPVRQAECLIDCARVHERLGQHREAASAYREALPLVEDESDLSLAIAAASGAGQALLALHDSEQATALFERAAALADQVNDHLRLAQVRLDLARCLLARGEAAAARSIATAALATFSAYRQTQQRAVCLERLAEAAFQAGDPAEGARLYREAAEQLHELGRIAEADAVLARWADVERDRAAYDNALRIDRERIARHEASGNRALLAQAFLHLGLIEAKRRDQAAALAAFQRARALWEALEDQSSMARADYHIAAALIALGERDDARQRLEQAAALAAAARDHRTEAEALASLVAVLRAAGDEAGTAATVQRWVEALRASGDREQEIAALGELAELGRRTGRLDRAEEALREVIALCQGDPQRYRVQLVDAHHHLGVLMARRGDLAGGLEQLQRALALLGEIPAYALRAHLRYRIGNCLLRLGRAREAQEQLQEALAACPDDKLRARILVDLGNAQALLGQEESAIDFFEQAARVAEQQGDVRATQIIRRQSGALKR
ncbi:MAG: tetratricopeptide repeat protein [Planctomycetota bacterium]|nr:tetratricopeptide repeat protein [Planctomycetota bacterium]MCX8040261.1 tetratricopeptide repeat protein [Planctomycetota bacterium]MDW8372444.1 tetratricopeptide repeat protein [Planctomycetota bacterium]